MQQWLEKNLKALNLTDTMILEEGFTRPGYSQAELQSMEVFKKIVQELGLKLRRDEAGNLIARWETGNMEDGLPAVCLGSHLDTVTNGGGYDGVAGVLCSLGAVKKLKEDGFKPDFPVEIICFASEESSRFGVSTIGSKAMAGLLNLEQLAEVADEDGITIKEAVEDTDLSWEAIDRAERGEDEIKSFVEVHIEQGTVIEDADAQFGAVSAVACPIRLMLSIKGKMGHTGTTPMGKRQDALVAAAQLITFISEQAEKLSSESKERLVATASTINSMPNAMNVIPGEVELGIDIRSVDDKLKEQMAEIIKEKCSKLENEFKVKIKLDTLVNNPSIELDEELMNTLLHLGEESGYRGHKMISGAGHDVMNMSRKWPAGLIFIPCRDGLSHHPEEHASLEDLEMGTDLLVSYINEKAVK